MIDISKLTEADIGAAIVYHDHAATPHLGVLSSWNRDLIFAKFRGPDSAALACKPEDVSFTDVEEVIGFDESYKAIRAAGGDAWDDVPNVADAIAEIRGMPQSAEACVEQLVAVLDRIEDTTKKRDTIDDAIHRLNFERRWALLTDKQRNHMCNTSLTDGQRQALWDAKAKGEKQYDALIAEYARSFYFRRAAWVAYLNGEGEPPIGE